MVSGSLVLPVSVSVPGYVYIFLYMNISIDLHNSVDSSQVRKLGMSLEDEGEGERREGKDGVTSKVLQSSKGCLSSARVDFSSPLWNGAPPMLYHGFEHAQSAHSVAHPDLVGKSQGVTKDI